MTEPIPSHPRRPPHEGCRLPLNIGFLPLPVDPISKAMTHPLRSTVGKAGGELLRGSPPLSGASVLSASRWEPLVPFPLTSPARFSRSIQVDHRHCLPAANETMLGYAVGIKPLAATA